MPGGELALRDGDEPGARRGEPLAHQSGPGRGLFETVVDLFLLSLLIGSQACGGRSFLALASDWCSGHVSLLSNDRLFTIELRPAVVVN